MTTEEKMDFIADILELELDDFNANSVLDEIEEWDSLAAISYIVMMDEQFNKKPSPEEIREFKTVQDILDTMN